MIPAWSRVICIASGPSLTPEDCETVYASGWPSVVTNSTFRTCPWADALYFFDYPWWRANAAEIRATFRGRCFTQSLTAIRGVNCVRSNPRFKNFGNAGANAVSLALVAGASSIVMLGYDCALGPNGKAHHHADHPGRNCDTLPRWPAQFQRLAEYAHRRGARVVNASRTTALDCFPRASLEDALR